MVATVVVLAAATSCRHSGPDAWAMTPPPADAPALAGPGVAAERLESVDVRLTAMEARLSAMEARQALVVDLLRARPAGAAPAEMPTVPTAGADIDAALGGAPGVVATGAAPSTTPPRTADPSREMLTAAGKEPAAEDRLLFYYPDDPNTLNPLIASDNVSNAWLKYLYDSLARQNYSNPSEWEPALAESWEFDEETLTYIIHLRRGVMWPEIKTPKGVTIRSEEFTAHDVKFTFDCILNRFTEAAPIRSYYIDDKIADETEKERIEVTVVDNHTIKVRWRRPYFLHKEYTLGGSEFFIVPEHVFGVDADGRPLSIDRRSKEFADAFNTHWAASMACGTGVMLLKDWTRTKGVEMVRNENYYGKPFYFSRISYKYYSNAETAIDDGRTGQLDFVPIAEKEKYLGLKDSAEAKAGKITPVQFRSMSYRYMGYNLDRPVLSDVKVRRAFAHATPIDQIIRDVFQGMAVPITGPMMPWTPFASPNVKPIPFDLDAARKLLDEAGWSKTGRDGVRVKTIKGVETPLTFDLLIYSDSVAFQRTAILIQESFRKIGVKVELKPQKWALMLERINNKNFDAILLGWVSDYKSDPQQLWHSSQADAPQGNNFGYRSKAVDAAIEKLQVTLDEAEQTRLYHEIHELIAADQPYTFLFAEDATAILNGRIQNFKAYPEIRPFYNPREWWSTSARTGP